MQMTQIQRDALTRARRGDFELADAIELEARIKRSSWAEDIVAGYRTHRLIALAEGELKYDRCANCDGHGKYTCSNCDGSEVLECPGCLAEGKPTGQVAGPLGVLVDCPACAGTKEVDCSTCIGGEVDCIECGGDGELLGTPQIHRVIDLNGRELWSEESEGGGQDNPEPGRLVDLAWAEAVIADYHNRSVAEGAGATKQEAA